ncbi:MAG TPA: hypothetical protein DCS93_26175 [Microscillaceae bacterium]|nr:hypothetical protein [Microscillaceae bacterium]
MDYTLSVVIPVYNEEKNLPEVIPEILTQAKVQHWQIIMVNDGSKDSSGKILDQWQLEHPQQVTIIHHKLNRGYGGAIKSGIQAAQAPQVITMDADGQHQVADVVKLQAHLNATDADMIIGNRKGQKEASFFRKIAKYIIRKIAQMALSTKVYDLNSGMKLYDRKLAQKYLKICPDTMAYSDIIALTFISQKHLVLEHPITVLPRKAGKSTINVKTAFETIKEILNILLFFNPLRFFIPLSIFFTVIGIAWEIPIFLRGDGMSVGALFLINLGILCFVLGLLAEQISTLRRNILH